MPSRTKFCRYSQFFEFIEWKTKALRSSPSTLIAHCRWIFKQSSRSPRRRRRGPEADDGRDKEHQGQIQREVARGRPRDVGRGCVPAVGVVARGVLPALLHGDGQVIAGRGAVLVGEAVTLER